MECPDLLLLGWQSFSFLLSLADNHKSHHSFEVILLFVWNQERSHSDLMILGLPSLLSFFILLRFHRSRCHLEGHIYYLWPLPSFRPQEVACCCQEAGGLQDLDSQSQEGRPCLGCSWLSPLRLSCPYRFRFGLLVIGNLLSAFVLQSSLWARSVASICLSYDCWTSVFCLQPGCISWAKSILLSVLPSQASTLASWQCHLAVIGDAFQVGAFSCPSSAFPLLALFAFLAPVAFSSASALSGSPSCPPQAQQLHQQVHPGAAPPSDLQE